jgi:hypothetical protein
MTKTMWRDVLIDFGPRDGSIHRIGKRSFMPVMTGHLLGPWIAGSLGTGEYILPTELAIRVRVLPSQRVRQPDSATALGQVVFVERPRQFNLPAKPRDGRLG